MYFSTVVVATIATVAPLASAHGSGVPQILGLDVADLKARNLLSSLGARFAEVGDAHIKPTVEAREDKPECGPGVGSCGPGLCCSRSGFCGTTDAFCYSPGCKFHYGPGCPENRPPSGTNTSSVPRDKLGSLAYGGTGIFRCVTPGTVALTYDDGPQKKFTSHILDLFKSYNAKATFFITGNNINKGQIDITDEYVSVIKRMDKEGHQIASHTWTHLDLSKDISSVDRKNQMWLNEMAIRNIVGKIPTYMRPPYSSCTAQSGCEQDMADLGYHVTNFNVDTDDYNQHTAENIQKAKDWFKGNITKDGATSTNDKWLAITHDIIEQTANNLTEFMLETVTKLGYKAVTVGECLGDPQANWYRTADGAGVGPGTTSLFAGDNTTASSSGGGSSTSASPSAVASKTGSASPRMSRDGTISLIAFGLTVSATFAYIF